MFSMHTYISAYARYGEGNLLTSTRLARNVFLVSLLTCTGPVHSLEKQRQFVIYHHVAYYSIPIVDVEKFDIFFLVSIIIIMVDHQIFNL